MSSSEKYLRPEVIRQVSRLDLRARFIVEGFLSGLHASPFHGFSVEFSNTENMFLAMTSRTWIGVFLRRLKNIILKSFKRRQMLLATW